MVEEAKTKAINALSELEIDKLLGIEKQGEQKPTKWSEEDEQYLLVCKNALAKYQTTDKWDADIISCWLENKLKAPQNRWKPSDEQMIALSEASGIVGMFTPRGMHLQSLYNDLKKLK